MNMQLLKQWNPNVPYISCVIIQAVSCLGWVLEDTSHPAAANLNCFVSQCSQRCYLERDTDLESRRAKFTSQFHLTLLSGLGTSQPFSVQWRFDPEIISLDPAIFHAESVSLTVESGLLAP